MAVRLNKYLADRGVGSRRKCDQLIADGRVRINGQVVSELGTKVEEQRDRVSVDGRPVGGRERPVYYVLNKPVGVITTLDDPEGRSSVRELLPPGARIYPVGRLDADTSGLLLLTNDGELAHRLMHPRYGVSKVYRVRLAREPRPEQLQRLARGVRFHGDQVSAPARVRRIDPGFDAIMIEVIVHEGRFRQVRRMCEAVGLEVTGLHRVGYGPLRLGPLARGMHRELSEEEVARLRSESARPGPTRGSRAPARTPRATARSPRAPAGGPRAAAGSPRAASKARAPEWPARATARRGDSGWRGDSAPDVPARPARPTRARPAPRTRRGSAESAARPARPTRARPAPRTRRGSTESAARPARPTRARPAPRAGRGRAESQSRPRRGPGTGRGRRNPSRRKPR